MFKIPLDVLNTNDFANVPVSTFKYRDELSEYRDALAEALQGFIDDVEFGELQQACNCVDCETRDYEEDMRKGVDHV